MTVHHRKVSDTYSYNLHLAQQCGGAQLSIHGAMELAYSATCEWDSDIVYNEIDIPVRREGLQTASNIVECLPHSKSSETSRAQIRGTRRAVDVAAATMSK